MSHPAIDPAATDRVLVTGAAGCVGSLVVDALLRAGRRVIAVDRPSALSMLADSPAVRSGAMEIRPADLTRPEEAIRAVEGAAGIIHTAAVVDIAKSFEELRPINLDAVVALYEASRASGVRAFVHFSTGSVYAPAPPGVALHENSLVTAGNPYIRTKLLSEDYLRARPAGGPRIAMLRPSLIFGPRGKVLAATLAAIPEMLGSSIRYAPSLAGGPRSNWVHALDVARAAVFLLEHDAPHAEVFNIANDDALPIGEIVTAAFRIAGLDVRGPALPYPTSLMRAMAPILDRDSIFGALNRAAVKVWDKIQTEHDLARELIPRLDREALPYAFRDTIFSNAKLRGLGFSLAHADFASGWTNTVDWYRSARWIPARAEVKS